MGNTASVRRGSVHTGPRLRHILQTGRRAAGNLSQRAAAERAGISLPYWQKIESGTLDHIPAGTLATMLTAIGASPEYLRDQGYAEVADVMEELTSMPDTRVRAEDYLAAVPGASAEEISALQAVWRALRAKRVTDPLESDLRHTRRDSGQQPQ